MVDGIADDVATGEVAVGKVSDEVDDSPCCEFWLLGVDCDEIIELRFRLDAVFRRCCSTFMYKNGRAEVLCRWVPVTVFQTEFSVADTFCA